MRKIILQEWLSLDGFAANEKDSTDFFASPELSEYSDKEIFNQMESIDTILLGANTYRMFVEFWPGADVKKEIMTEKINSTPKIVFSKSLTSAPWGKWPEATLVKSDAVEEVRKLKSGSGKDMVLWGSLSLAGSLITAGLIDVLEFRIVPIALGKGKPFFRDFGHQVNFKTNEASKYPSGLVLLRYTV